MGLQMEPNKGTGQAQHEPGAVNSYVVRPTRRPAGGTCTHGLRNASHDLGHQHLCTQPRSLKQANSCWHMSKRAQPLLSIITNLLSMCAETASAAKAMAQPWAKSWLRIGTDTAHGCALHMDTVWVSEKAASFQARDTMIGMWLQHSGVRLCGPLHDRTTVARK